MLQAVQTLDMPLMVQHVADVLGAPLGVSILEPVVHID
jgi:hypothetical protein